MEVSYLASENIECFCAMYQQPKALRTTTQMCRTILLRIQAVIPIVQH